MSIVVSDKTARKRLTLRWPFSRQLTLSVGTLLVLLAVWWAVAAQQWISPLFLPSPGQVLVKLFTIAGPERFMDATLWQHLAASLGRILVALLAAVILGIPVGIAMGLSPTVRGILDPLIELYRPVPPLSCSKPAIRRRQVVLPEPEGPSMEKNSPSRIRIVTPSTARTSPYRRETSLNSTA